MPCITALFGFPPRLALAEFWGVLVVALSLALALAFPLLGAANQRLLLATSVASALDLLLVLSHKGASGSLRKAVAGSDVRKHERGRLEAVLALELALHLAFGFVCEVVYVINSRNSTMCIIMAVHVFLKVHLVGRHIRLSTEGNRG